MHIIKKYKWFILTFFITMLLITSFFVLMGCFTGKSILNSDMLAQHFPLLQYLKTVIEGDSNFIYSLSKGVGGGMYGTFFYYLSNPLNLLVYFFDDITLFLILNVILKISLCGLAMNIFMSYKFKQNNWAIVIFSIAYAIMGYNINYFTNIMWLDGVLLAPIILIGIEKIIENKKPWLYIISLFIAIFTNYYIGYMLCLFSLIYFGYNVLLKYDYKKDKKEIKKQFINFFIITLLVGIMCSFILIPSGLELLNTERLTGLGTMKFANLNFFDYFAPLYIGFGSLLNPLNSFGFNMYCGFLIPLLIILYFKNGKISSKEKKLTAIVFLILLLPITFNYLNYIWHMFSATTFFNYRYSFLFVLFALFIAFKSYLVLEVNKRALTVSFIIFIIISVALLYLTHSVPDYYIYLNWYKIVASLALVLIYIFLLLKNKKKLLLLVLSLDIVANLFIIGYSSKLPDRSEDQKYLDAFAPLVSKCSEKRCEGVIGVIKNESLYFGYNGVSTFLTTTNKKPYTFLSNSDGVSPKRNFYVYAYPNPIIDMLIGVDYILAEDRFTGYEFIESVTDGYSIIKNPRPLSLGYLVSADALLDKEISETGILYQQTILNILGDKNNDYFVQIPYNQLDELNYEFLVDVDSPYLYISSNKAPAINGDEDIKYAFVGNTYGVLYNEYNGNNLLLTYLEEPEYIDLYYLDEAKLDEFYNYISEREFEILENEGNYIKGNIAVDERRVFLLTIPYEEGWAVKVNGQEIEAHAIFDTFIGIELDKGNYVVELEYRVVGLKEGIIVSIIAFISLLAYMIITSKKFREVKK